MSFTQNQVRKLRSRLKPQHIKTREADGITLSYLEGWHVIAEANRIFGFDGWDRETVSSHCVWKAQVNGRYCASYIAQIRIRVRAGDRVVVREGSGTGESSASSAGQAHEFAAKAAETDATKRALMTFGNAFGLSLYGGAIEERDKAKNSKAGPALPQPAGGRHGVSEEQGSTAKLKDPETRESVPIDTADELASGPTSSDRGHYSPPVSLPAPVRPAGPTLLVPVALPHPNWPHFSPLDEAERMNADRQERVDKSELELSEPRRLRHSGHLAYVASRPCLICGRNRAHAHHLKFAQPTALGRKVSDEFTVPLCSTHHRELHQNGDERKWWAERGIEPLGIASELWLTTVNRYGGPVSSPVNPHNAAEGGQT